MGAVMPLSAGEWGEQLSHSQSFQPLVPKVEL